MREKWKQKSIGNTLKSRMYRVFPFILHIEFELRALSVGRMDIIDDFCQGSEWHKRARRCRRMNPDLFVHLPFSTLR